MSVFNRKNTASSAATTQQSGKQRPLSTQAQQQVNIIRQTQTKFILLCMSVIALVLVLSFLIVITVATANRTQDLFDEMYENIRSIAIETPTLEISNPFSSDNSGDVENNDAAVDSLRDAIEDALNNNSDADSVRESLEALGIYSNIMGNNTSSSSSSNTNNSTDNGSNTSDNNADTSGLSGSNIIGNITNSERNDITTKNISETEEEETASILTSLYELIFATLLNSDGSSTNVIESSTISVSVYQFDEYHQAALLSGSAQLSTSEVNTILDAIDDELVVAGKLQRFDSLDVYIVQTAVYDTSYFAVVPVSAMDNYINGFTSMLLNSGIVVVFLLFVFVYAVSFQVVKPVRNAWNEQKRFITDASHELRTPVAVVMASAEAALTDDTLREDTRKWLEAILAKSEDMSTLVNDLLSSVTLDTTNPTTKPETSPVDFVETVERIVLQFQPLAFESGNIINTEISADIKKNGATVVANKTEIERVVSILLDNAIKYSADNTNIDVELSYSSKSKLDGNDKKLSNLISRSVTRRTTCVLRVTSTGDVVPPDEAGKIFDRFYRVDKSREVKRGSGIGLSLAKQIVDELHGSITCCPNGSETTFEIFLPCSLPSSHQKHGQDDDNNTQSDQNGTIAQSSEKMETKSENGEILIG